MKGTIVNTIAVLVGSGIGLLIKKGVPPHIEEAVMKILGLAVCLIGLNGVLGTMFTADLATGALVESGTLLLLVSLVLGALAGELLKIDYGVERFGRWIEKKTGTGGVAKGFVAGSLMFCIGAMSIVGALNDGLGKGSDILFLKSALDFTTSLILASTLGVGVMIAGGSVLIYQGAISLASGLLKDVLVGDLLGSICMVGYAIVICIGLNLLLDTKIKTANLLPAMLVPVLGNLFMMLKTLW